MARTTEKCRCCGEVKKLVAWGLCWSCRRKAIGGDAKARAAAAVRRGRAPWHTGGEEKPAGDPWAGAEAEEAEADEPAEAPEAPEPAEPADDADDDVVAAVTEFAAAMGLRRSGELSEGLLYVSPVNGRAVVVTPSGAIRDAKITVAPAAGGGGHRSGEVRINSGDGSGRRL